MNCIIALMFDTITECEPCLKRRKHKPAKMTIATPRGSKYPEFVYYCNGIKCIKYAFMQVYSNIQKEKDEIKKDRIK